MLIFLTVLIGAVSHVFHDFQTELLSLFTFTMMLADKCDKTFGKTDKTYAESTLIYHTFNRIIRAELLRPVP